MNERTTWITLAAAQQQLSDLAAALRGVEHPIRDEIDSPVERERLADELDRLSDRLRSAGEGG